MFKKILCRIFALSRKQDKQFLSMTKQQLIQVFEERKVRTIWDNKTEEWYFSVIDVVAVLTDSVNPGAYWRKLKQRLKAEGNETVTNCHSLKLEAPDGKMRKTDVIDTQQLFRLIQSIPSPKAEPFKLWVAQVAKERLDQMQDPELSIEQAIYDYRKLGYSENWINQRIRSIEVRKTLTDEWRRGGIEEGIQFASLTDIITRQWSGKTTKEYKQHKGLRKENLRDNMTNIELALNTVAEASAAELSKEKSPKGFSENANIARQGGDVAKSARDTLEKQLGRTVITSGKATDHILRQDSIEDIDSLEIEGNGI